jgi:hypothetical protein
VDIIFKKTKSTLYVCTVQDLIVYRVIFPMSPGKDVRCCSRVMLAFQPVRKSSFYKSWYVVDVVLVLSATQFFC